MDFGWVWWLRYSFFFNIVVFYRNYSADSGPVCVRPNGNLSRSVVQKTWKIFAWSTLHNGNDISCKYSYSIDSNQVFSFSIAQHLLPLPGFLLLYSNIWQHIQITNASEPMMLPLLGTTMPSQWVYLIGNVLTQYICISSVYVLTAECSSLTVTLVVTLRKFVSLLFSIVYFDNPFTIHHWIGTLLVFVGTIIFTEVVPSIRKSISGRGDGSKMVTDKKKE